ncbi:MAG: signal peptidase I [Chloroflexota bacterium]|nr:signal peptidase I [Chloroflexota bacterium]
MARIGRLIMLKALPALVGIALAAAWFVVFRPASLGGPASYVIVAGRSMESTLWMHDLAIVRRQDTYRVGDVIAFRVPEGEVIHRIVGGDAAQGFVTQGDNNPSPDLWRPRPAQVEGAVWARVPAGGRVIEFLRQPVNAAIAVSSLAALWLLLRGETGPRRRDAAGDAAARVAGERSSAPRTR